MAYIPNCNSKFISLGQIYDSNIIYVGNSKVIILIQIEHVIANAKCNRNFFILELAIPNKAMQITGCGYPIYLINKNKKVKI